ncbi:hypothetical protein [Mycolicibacterium arseniciresistens]|uniref:Uncharacterized protein n=1 Tax=Mycolicibacterium arseniciresistens TaxID=3062257 RepID=A0ABT8UCK8_9MYCO|nr:hypothetical protein [Mycolicibacterium arseniciresistens]MDO3634600.1 hypothetical protein [Mycolicibacterium arseniciresistens]
MPAITKPVWAHTWFANIWPIVAAIMFATFVAFGSGPADHTDVAPVVTASAFVYLGAAALQRRVAAWPMFFVSVIVITIGFLVPGIGPSWSSWAMVGVSGVLLGYGLIRGALRPLWGAPLQAAALAVFAAAAIAAVHVDATWAGLLVGAGLLAHTAWDINHHRTERVVASSMALFCAVLDTFLAVVVLAVTLA